MNVKAYVYFMYQCSVCNEKTPQWQGKCPSCGNWNTLSEVIDTSSSGSGKKATKNKKQSISNEVETFTLKDIVPQLNSDENRRYTFSHSILNDFFGGGVPTDGFYLLAGEPGLGKSTLALQLLRSLLLGDVTNAHYFTAEESYKELGHRCIRLDIPKNLVITQTNNIDAIEKTIKKEKPQVVVIDSIQTLFSTEIDASPGSVSQVTMIATQLLSICKSIGCSIFLIGHVTKDGQIAGPKTLEHLVDAVMLLEASKQNAIRTLTFNKNRFGQTDVMLLLKMVSSGLEILADPSLALLENVENGPGIIYGIAVDKNMPLIVEIQALVTSKSTGRREAIGIKASKMHTLIALVEKYLGIDFSFSDIYIQVVGLPNSFNDTSLDVPIMLALASAALDKEVNVKKGVFAGRVTLNGNIRNATNTETRKKVSKQLGFTYNPKVSEYTKIGELIACFTPKQK